jgi:alanyl-tRNA synthetase
MTEKIYQDDSYCREAVARITAREEAGGRWRVRCDRTIFCPEGGGQPPDRGTLNGLPLLVLEADGDDVVHVLAADPGAGEARMVLDFERRYDHMQQHTAQHLLSQVLLRDFGAATLSFAIGPEHSSIEIGRPAFGEEEVRSLEDACARLIFADRAVRVFQADDLSGLHLRKPPKVAGRIRVVEIDGVDQSACGGTHLRSSAEIGLLKIVGSERVRANVRLFYAAGARALRDYQLKHEVTQRLQRLVTQPPAAIPAQVENLLKEKDELRRALKKARRREMEREVAAASAAGGPGLVVREFSGLEAAELRFFVTALAKGGRHALAYQQPPPLPTAADEGGDLPAGARGYVVIGRGRGDLDLRRLSARVFELLAGKGGGSAGLVEGRGRDFSRIAEVIALLRAELGA